MVSLQTPPTRFFNHRWHGWTQILDPKVLIRVHPCDPWSISEAIYFLRLLSFFAADLPGVPILFNAKIAKDAKKRPGGVCSLRPLRSLR